MARHRIAAGALVVLAIVGAGCGSGNDAPPFTVTDSSVRNECLTGTFLPDAAGVPLASAGVPDDWREVEREPGAYSAAKGAAEVVIRPKQDGEKLTLTEVDFKISAGDRPIGLVFYRPCSRHLVGAAIEADVDEEPIPIIASSADAGGVITPGFHLQGRSDPIRFPWTVTLTEPLRLYLIAKASFCYCVWSARIPWKSGDQEGVIQVDNGGRKYRVVEGKGMLWREPAPSGKWAYPATPAWVGVK